MSKEQFEQLAARLRELVQEIESLPESSCNGLLIDAAGHLKSSSEHLQRYFRLRGAK